MAVWSVPKLGIELLEYFELVLDSVGIFSYLCYSLAKSHVNGWGCSEA